jgi:Cu-Zn family superoxide dismutase
MRINFSETLAAKPAATAQLRGGDIYPLIRGEVDFYDAGGGTLVRVEAVNLPEQTPPGENTQPIGPFAFHIHEGGACTGDFSSSGGHYNPTGQLHALHAGDLPPLFSNNGYAYMTVYTNRFKPKDVIGRTVILHENPDDFRTQPAGNSGRRIAFGVIR